MDEMKLLKLLMEKELYFMCFSIEIFQNLWDNIISNINKNKGEET